MEILIGFVFGIIVFLLFYWDYVKQIKHIDNLIKTLKNINLDMDEKAEDRVFAKIEKIESRLNHIEIAMGVLKTKVAFQAAIFSSIGAIVASVGVSILLHFVL
jgi:hypothetical protein